MSGEPCRFHSIWMPDYLERQGISIYGNTGGGPVGLSDARFPSPGWVLRRDWPGLRYDKPDTPPSLLTGERLTSDLAERLWRPIRVEMRNGPGDLRALPACLPDWLVVSGVPVISERAMEIIEATEPGRHQFFPAKLEAWGTHEPLYGEQKFGYLNVLNWIAPDLLYDFEAMDGAPSVETGVVRFSDQAAPGFNGPMTSKTISLQNHNFTTWFIRPDWVGTGHVLSTSSYSKTRLTRISAASFVFVSDELHSKLSQRLPPNAFCSRPYDVSRRLPQNNGGLTEWLSRKSQICSFGGVHL